jgi:hypothetical protein
MENVAVEKSRLEMRVIVTFNVLTGEMGVEGCDKNPVVALGMLDYALARVRRALATNDILQDAQNSPRIAIPRGPLA